MKKEISQNEFRKYYLSEFELYDGEAFITFNIFGIFIPTIVFILDVSCFF